MWPCRSLRRVQCSTSFVCISTSHSTRMTWMSPAHHRQAEGLPHGATSRKLDWPVKLRSTVWTAQYLLVATVTLKKCNTEEMECTQCVRLYCDNRGGSCLGRIPSLSCSQSPYRRLRHSKQSLKCLIVQLECAERIRAVLCFSVGFTTSNRQMQMPLAQWPKAELK